MICTVTFNPSLDYVLGLDSLRLGGVNRASREAIMPGGKGINVSIVLNNLGYPSRALGFIAGFTGDEIARRLADMGIETDFIPVDEGMSRINVKISAEEETEVNGMGPDIPMGAIGRLFGKLDALGAGDVLVVSGSVPSSLPADIYERILAHLEGRGVCIAVDATRDLLMNVLPYKPFLIKPNNHELGEIFGVELERRRDVVPYAERLCELGARNVLVSMAGEGAVLVSASGAVIESPAPTGSVVNSVGAGDSMVAGFIAGYLESGGDLDRAFRMGLCTGSASAFSLGLANREQVDELLGRIRPY